MVVVGKSSGSRSEDEPWRCFVNKGFEPDPRLNKVEEAVNDVPWYTDVHTIPLRRLLERYGGSITKGLSDVQVIRNRQLYGANVNTSTESHVGKCLELLKSVLFGLNSLIWICLIFSLTIFTIRWVCLKEKPIEHLIFAGFLFFSIILTTVSFYYQTHRTHRLLTEEQGSGAQCTLVRRNGRFIEIPSCELVVGDIIQMSYGDVIPADVRIIESHEFFVDNSGLTGESDPKRRRSMYTDVNPMETKNMAFFSTYALEGYAKGVVVNVGSNTVMGRVTQVAGRVHFKQKSPVQKEMDSLVKLLICQSIFFGSFFFAVSIIITNDWKEALVYLMAVVVANVPEGLALTSTILLALISKKLQGLRCVVKNLHTIETLGATTVVVTDKTGTITQNKMAIAHLWFDDHIGEADTSEFLDGHQTFNKDDPGFQAVARVARLCSRAKFKPHEMDKAITKREVLGDASEAAILRFMEAQMGSVSKYRRKYKKIFEIPFNSRRKIQAFVYEINDSGKKQHYLTVKGAPERLFEMCTSILIKDKAYTLDEKWTSKFNIVLEKLGSIGDRVIGLADALLPRDKFNEDYIYDADKPEMFKVGLRFVGLLSMIDPPRAVVPEAVQRLKKAGVKIVMITGDHSTTSTAIARATGIFPPLSLKYVPQNTNCNGKTNPAMQSDKPQKIFTGKDLIGIEPRQLDLILCQEGDMIFARTTPEQKYIIVESLQRLGHVVTVVGDGVNDCPIVKRADVGIVMGVTGSEVSKEIGDIVLLDDNFASVVDGIEEGRLGFENCKKLLRYTMADNIAQMYYSGLSILLRVPQPFAPMAMLLTVLGTDLIPAMSLCYEQKEKNKSMRKESLLQRKLITSSLLCHIYTQVAVFEVAAGFFAYFCTMACYGFTPLRLISVKRAWEDRNVNDLMDSLYGQEWTYVGRKKLESHCQAVFFIAIVIMQVANLLICKGDRQSIQKTFFLNWRIGMGICIELTLAASLLYIPRISAITGLLPITIGEWLYAVPFALLLVLCDELRRLSLRRKWIGPGLSDIILH